MAEYLAAKIDNADFVITYNDATLWATAIELRGTLTRSFRFTLLDPVKLQSVASKVISPGDRMLSLPAPAQALAAVTFAQRTRPGDGAVVTVLTAPTYRIDLVG